MAYRKTEEAAGEPWHERRAHPWWGCGGVAGWVGHVGVGETGGVVMFAGEWLMGTVVGSLGLASGKALEALDDAHARAKCVSAVACALN